MAQIDIHPGKARSAASIDNQVLDLNKLHECMTLIADRDQDPKVYEKLTNLMLSEIYIYQKARLEHDYIKKAIEKISLEAGQEFSLQFFIRPEYRVVGNRLELIVDFSDRQREAEYLDEKGYQLMHHLLSESGAYAEHWDDAPKIQKYRVTEGDESEPWKLQRNFIDLEYAIPFDRWDDMSWLIERGLEI